MIGPTSSLTDVAFAVCTALDRHGFQAVLTGGSAATYYAPETYQSGDLDFVLTLKVEFPHGPLAVGDDLIKRWSTVRRDDEVLYVLSPTDSCRDRLASFLFWNDFSGLEQALAVFRARAHEVDLNLIEDWCRREGHSQKFGLFASRIGAST